MKNLLKVFILLILISCGSSKEEEDGLKVYDLDQEIPRKELDIEDLMEDPELVFLETSDESLLPAYFLTLISDDYIITTDRKSILLFNRDGSFVKQLAGEGRGPGELLYMTSWMLGPEEKFLYVVHQGNSEAFTVYDIDDGSHTILNYPDPPYSLVSLNDNWVLAGGMTRSPFETYELNLETGEVRNYVEREPDNSPVGNTFMIAKVDRDIFYSDSDTLFLLENGKKRPYQVFSVKNSFDPNSSSGLVSTIRFGLITPSFTTISKSNLDIGRSEGRLTSMRTVSREIYYLERNDESIFKIDKLSHENSDELNSLGRLQQNGNYRSLYYEAHTWLDIVENSDEIPEQWKEQSKNLGLEDNPVLIIGKAK